MDQEPAKPNPIADFIAWIGITGILGIIGYSLFGKKRHVKVALKAGKLLDLKAKVGSGLGGG